MRFRVIRDLRSLVKPRDCTLIRTMTMRIIGLDVCKNAVVAWALDELPKNLKEHFKTNRRPDTKQNPDPLKFYATTDGIKALLSLAPDAIALEPTGIHYSWIFAHIAKREGIPVLWVGHSEVRHFRMQARLPDKNDQADALALAAYALQYWGQEHHFLSFDHDAIVGLRELYLQLKSVVRIQSPVINRARQQLAREFPEAALKQSDSKGGKIPALWGWLAEHPVHKRNPYPKLYQESIAPLYGVELSGFTRKLSSTYCDLLAWETELERELHHILKKPEFLPYIKIMSLLGMGARCQALLISQIYPVGRFESLGAFKRRLGVAKVEVSSGDRKGSKSGHGSQMCATELYLWVLTTIAPVKMRPKNAIASKVVEFYEDRKARFENPDYWLEKHQQRQQREAISKLKGLLTPEQLENPALLAVLATLTQQNPAKPSEDAKRGFGRLILCQTASYGVRVLYRELNRELRSQIE